MGDVDIEEMLVEEGVGEQGAAVVFNGSHQCCQLVQTNVMALEDESPEVRVLLPSHVGLTLSRHDNAGCPVLETAESVEC